MGRIGVSYEDVATAAQKIQQQGNLPTIERIRAELSTGSYSTLSALLKEWKGKQALQQQYAANGRLPDELVTAVQKVWETITEQTAQTLATLREEAKAEQQALQQHCLQQQETAQKLQASHASLNEKHRLLSNEKLALEQVLQEQKINAATLLATNDSLEKQLTEKQVRIDELTRLNQQAQNNLEHYRQAAREQRLLEQQQHENRLNELEQRNHQLQENWTVILTQNTQLKSEAQQLLTTQEKLTHDYSTLYKKADSIQAQLTEAKQLATEKQQLAQHWQTQQQASQEKIDLQQTRLIELEKCTAAFSEKSALLEEKITELTSQNKMLAHDKWLLDQEKSQLYGQLKQLEAV